jgi:lipoprotein NlpD
MKMKNRQNSAAKVPPRVLIVCALVLALNACSSRVPLNPPPVQNRSATDAAKPKRPDLYTVQKGDSLLGIAQRYQLTSAEILQWNSLPAGQLLQAGQVLRLTPPPGMATTSPSPSAPAPGVTIGAVKPAPVEGKPLDGRPLEAKPLESKPLESKPAEQTSKPVLATSPRGTKRPYSEALLAEMSGQPLPAAPKDDKAVKGGNWGWPSAGKVVQDYQAPKSNGLVIAGKLGDPILAVADGSVIFSGEGPRGFGNLVIVKHAGDLVSVYGNNKSLSVKEGQVVKKGARLAEMGSSGTDKTQLLFEVRQAGKPVDPNKFLASREVKAEAKPDAKSIAKP